MNISRRCVAVGVVTMVGLCTGLIGVPRIVRAAGPSVEAAYEQRFKALEPDDVGAHIQLALWCRQEQAWKLLLKECNYILSVDPQHAVAKRLAELARAKLKTDKQGKSDRKNKRSQAAGSAAPRAKVLSDRQVQILKRTALNPSTLANVKFKFHNDVLNRFWDQFEAARNPARQARTSFFKSSVADKVWMVFGSINQSEVDPSLADDIEILNDPMMFDVFNRRVWPVVKRGCATARCHGGSQARAFRLYGDPSLTTNQKYTNYLILHEYEKQVDERVERLIDCDTPQRSLLLRYGAAVGGRDLTEHPGSIRPPFGKGCSEKCEVIGNWIGGLGAPRPEYEISLEYPER